MKYAYKADYVACLKELSDLLLFNRKIVEFVGMHVDEWPAEYRAKYDKLLEDLNSIEAGPNVKLILKASGIGALMKNNGC